jgi:hypothetical protein
MRRLRPGCPPLRCECGAENARCVPAAQPIRNVAVRTPNPCSDPYSAATARRRRPISHKVATRVTATSGKTP